MYESESFKKIAAVVLILLSGGAWIYLDMWNEQEKQAAIQLHREMQQAGAQARSRVETKSKFETHILLDLNNCKAAAETAKNFYLSQNQKPVLQKKTCLLTVPDVIVEEAEKMVATANQACQAKYDAYLQNGGW